MAPPARFTRNDWRRISKIVFWLLAFPPAGLYMLWKDPVLPKALKIRIAIYSLVGTVAFFVAFGLFEIHSVQSVLKDLGVDS